MERQLLPGASRKKSTQLQFHQYVISTQVIGMKAKWITLYYFIFDGCNVQTEEQVKENISK